jgi:hypothetical protein
MKQLLAQVEYNGPWLPAEWFDSIHHQWLKIEGVGARHVDSVRYKYEQA